MSKVDIRVKYIDKMPNATGKFTITSNTFIKDLKTLLVFFEPQNNMNAGILQMLEELVVILLNTQYFSRVINFFLLFFPSFLET